MTTNKFEVVLLAYLDARAKFDEQFAAKYSNPKKSIKECAKYICNEMRKQAENGVAVGEDDYVFGLAVHYYDEENLDCSKLDNCVAQVTAAINPAPKKSAKAAPKKAAKSEAKKAVVTKPVTPAKPVTKPQAKKPAQGAQMDLFGDYNPFI